MERMTARLIEEGWKLYHSIKSGNGYRWENDNLEFVIDMLDGEDVDDAIIERWSEVL